MQRNPSHTESEPKVRFFDNILNYIPDLIFVKDASHRWVYVNDAFCTALGHRRETLIGKTDYDLIADKLAKEQNGLRRSSQGGGGYLLGKRQPGSRNGGLQCQPGGVYESQW